LTALAALWRLSLVLCVIALLILAAIVTVRLVTRERAERRERERRRVTPVLLGVHSQVPALPRAALERETAARLALEMAELVRGTDRDALLANAESLRIPDVLHRQSLSRSPQERLLAAEALAMFPSGRKRVHAMLRDRNADVRLGAALALAQHQAAPPAAELVRALHLGSRERSLLMTSLMRDLVESDPGSVEQLLADPRLPDAARLAALDALASSGRVEHAPLMAAMAGEEGHESNLLARIHHALGRIGHPSGHDAILRGLAHPSWEVRAAAAQAAGASALTAACDRLGTLLDDDVWWVRFRATEALWRLGAQGHNVLEQVAARGSERAAEVARLTLDERRAR
jgi:HEAT repeat protein